MTGRTEMVDDVAVIVLTDELVRDGLADLRGQLRSSLLAGARTVIVDVGCKGTLSSELVAALLSAHRICRARSGRLMLRNPSRRTQELLTRTGLSRVLLPEHQ